MRQADGGSEKPVSLYPACTRIIVRCTLKSARQNSRSGPKQNTG